jgi:hypothetical protein
LNNNNNNNNKIVPSDLKRTNLFGGKVTFPEITSPISAVIFA